MSTMVPMAIAIPERATMFASTPPSFMKMKVNSTAMGNRDAIRKDARRCINMNSTTRIVTRISSEIAVFSVPRVSWIKPERS